MFEEQNATEIEYKSKQVHFIDTIKGKISEWL
jgi:hypothetical protein